MRKPRNYYSICYSNIQQRCYNENHPDYNRYGGRGITCYWNNQRDFMRGVIAEIGERPPGLEIDRIENDGNYEPGNLRWLDRSGQVMNQERWQNRPAHSNNSSGWRWVYPSPCGGGKLTGWQGRFYCRGKCYITPRKSEPATCYLGVLSLKSLLQ